MLKLICKMRPNSTFRFQMGNIYNGELVKSVNSDLQNSSYPYSIWRVYTSEDKTNFVYSHVGAGHFVEMVDWRNSQLEKIGL